MSHYCSRFQLKKKNNIREKKRKKTLSNKDLIKSLQKRVKNKESLTIKQNKTSTKTSKKYKTNNENGC
jgi:hypothetical protein